MPGTSFIYRRNITEGCVRNYAVAEQWLATYRISNNPRHLATARICFVIADECYSTSFNRDFDYNQSLMQQIRAQSRKQVTEAFAALGHAPYIADNHDLAAAPVDESPDLSQ